MGRFHQHVSAIVTILCIVLAFVYMWLGEDVRCAVMIGWAILSRMNQDS